MNATSAVAADQFAARGVVAAIYRNVDLLIADARSAGVGDAEVERFLRVLTYHLPNPVGAAPTIWQAFRVLTGQTRIRRGTRIAITRLLRLTAETCLSQISRVATNEFPGERATRRPMTQAPTGADRPRQPVDCHPETGTPAGPDACGRLFQLPGALGCMPDTGHPSFAAPAATDMPASPASPAGAYPVDASLIGDWAGATDAPASFSTGGFGED